MWGCLPATSHPCSHLRTQHPLEVSHASLRSKKYVCTSVSDCLCCGCSNDCSCRGSGTDNIPISPEKSPTDATHFSSTSLPTGKHTITQHLFSIRHSYAIPLAFSNEMSMFSSMLIGMVVEISMDSTEATVTVAVSL